MFLSWNQYGDDAKVNDSVSKWIRDGYSTPESVVRMARSDEDRDQAQTTPAPQPSGRPAYYHGGGGGGSNRPLPDPRADFENNEDDRPNEEEEEDDGDVPGRPSTVQGRVPFAPPAYAAVNYWVMNATANSDRSSSTAAAAATIGAKASGKSSGNGKGVLGKVKRGMGSAVAKTKKVIVSTGSGAAKAIASAKRKALKKDARKGLTKRSIGSRRKRGRRKRGRSRSRSRKRSSKSKSRSRSRSRKRSGRSKSRSRSRSRKRRTGRSKSRSRSRSRKRTGRSRSRSRSRSGKGGRSKSKSRSRSRSRSQSKPRRSTGRSRSRSRTRKGGRSKSRSKSRGRGQGGNKKNRNKNRGVFSWRKRGGKKGRKDKRGNGGKNKPGSRKNTRAEKRERKRRAKERERERRRDSRDYHDHHGGGGGGGGGYGYVPPPVVLPVPVPLPRDDYGPPPPSVSFPTPVVSDYVVSPPSGGNLYPRIDQVPPAYADQGAGVAAGPPPVVTKDWARDEADLSTEEDTDAEEGGGGGGGVGGDETSGIDTDAESEAPSDTENEGEDETDDEEDEEESDYGPVGLPPQLEVIAEDTVLSEAASDIPKRIEASLARAYAGKLTSNDDNAPLKVGAWVCGTQKMMERHRKQQRDKALAEAYTAGLSTRATQEMIGELVRDMDAPSEKLGNVSGGMRFLGGTLRKVITDSGTGDVKYASMIAVHGDHLLGEGPNDAVRARRWISRMVKDAAKSTKDVIYDIAKVGARHGHGGMRGHGHGGGGGFRHHHHHSRGPRYLHGHHHHHHGPVFGYRPHYHPWWVPRLYIGDKEPRAVAPNHWTGASAGAGAAAGPTRVLEESTIVLQGRGSIEGAGMLMAYQRPQFLSLFREDLDFDTASMIEAMGEAMFFFRQNFGLDFARRTVVKSIPIYGPREDGYDADSDSDSPPFEIPLLGLTRIIPGVAVFEPFLVNTAIPISVMPLAGNASASGDTGSVRIGGFQVTMIAREPVTAMMSVPIPPYPYEDNGTTPTVSGTIELKPGMSMLFGEIVIRSHEPDADDNDDGDGNDPPSADPAVDRKIKIHFETRTPVQLPVWTPNEGTAAGCTGIPFDMDSHHLPDGSNGKGKGHIALEWGSATPADRRTDVKVTVHMTFERVVLPSLPATIDRNRETEE